MSRSLLGVILTVVLLLELGKVPAVSSTSISIADNGYSNIVVAISPDVPDTYAETILNNIQTMIQGASSVLYRATKQRAYYKDVRILIPDSWTNIQADESTWETYSTSDVQVAPAGGPYGEAPYTVQSGGCGQPGEQIQLTPEYLSTIGQPQNTEKYGPAEKVFVYEWARLRYGVFEEFGQKGNNQFPLFYKSNSDHIEVPNLCTDKPPSFTTKNLKTQLPCKVNLFGAYVGDCVYILDPEFKPASSLMSLYSVDSVVEFCEDGDKATHNHMAKTKHNDRCESKAVWTIISSHPDFENSNNPPTTRTDLKPNFKIIRSGGGSRFVLVMDTSGSMSIYDRITRLHDSAMRWIKEDISNGSQLGLVKFYIFSLFFSVINFLFYSLNLKINTKWDLQQSCHFFVPHHSHQGIKLSDLVLIDGQQSRDSLISKLSIWADGGTCIGCGLLKALEILKPGGQGGVIVLVTDGEENEYPMINDVLQQIIDAKIRVVSIAFGRFAEDKIEDLAKQTNGKSYFIDDNDTSQGLNNAFIGSLTYQPAVSSKQIVVSLFQKQFQKVTSGTISNSFAVDSTVGRNLNIRIDYTQQSYLRSFSLKSPNGTIYTQLNYDSANKFATFELDLAEVGDWNMTLTVTNSMYDSLAVQVTSLSRSDTIEPITTKCYVPNDIPANPVRILAQVMQGKNPVIQAKVQAYVEIPDGSLQIIDLFDNGVPADTTADDGIYSRYFTLTEQGRYTVICQVWNDGSAYINNGFIAMRNGRQDKPKEIGSFTRVANGGSFKITEPIPKFNGTNDYYPPSRVVDLKVIQANNIESNKSITIQFTAPGDELDWGTAFKYEIRYSTEFDDLRPDNFNLVGNSTLVLPKHIINGSLQPSPSGSKELIVFTVNIDSSTSKTYFIALRAIDRVGQIGRASNIVSALFPSQQQCQSSW